MPIHDELNLPADSHPAPRWSRVSPPHHSASHGIWAKKFSSNKPGPTKNQVYECGLESTGDGWTQFKPAYYLYALVFLIFDVEAVFVLPFAVAFSRFSLAECVAMLVFLLLLVEGLVWACRKNVLTWT